MLAHDIVAAAGQAWAPFALVAGLLLIGAVAAADGLFEGLGARLASTRLGPRGLLAALLAMDAVVTAVLNLDTSVVFLTPVLVHAARRRRLNELPFLYGAVFMANAASLLLPGSNLTNLLVLRDTRESGAAYALEMLPAWIAVCVLTAAFVALAFRLETADPDHATAPPLRLGSGAAGALAASALVVVLANPALPVLGVGLVVTAAARLRPRLDARALLLLFTLSVALGTVARLWNGPGRLLESSGAWAAAAIAAVASIVVNNLPAAELLSAQPPPHPNALLIGLDLGPNLAVTGSLSAVLWLQTARALGCRPSIATFTRLGLILVPPTLAVALAALTVSK